MKKDNKIKYYDKAIIECSCGNVLEVGSTQEKIHVEICSACHPFFTGKQKLVDSAGRVDQFKAKLAKAQELAAQKKSSEKKPKSEQKTKSISPQELKEKFPPVEDKK